MIVEDLGGFLYVAPGSFKCLRNRLTLDLVHVHVGRDDAAVFSGVRSVKLFG